MSVHIYFHIITKKSILLTKAKFNIVNMKSLTKKFTKTKTTRVGGFYIWRFACGYSPSALFRPPRAVPEIICLTRDFGSPHHLSRCCICFDVTTFGGHHLTLTATKRKRPAKARLFCFGGSGWIRTTEVEDNRFTVCPLWPLGNTPIFSYTLELVDGLEPPTCWLQISCSTNWATPA